MKQQNEIVFIKLMLHGFSMKLNSDVIDVFLLSNEYQQLVEENCMYDGKLISSKLLSISIFVLCGLTFIFNILNRINN